MNVNITGIYDNTVVVDSNLFDDVKLLQTGLSSLSDTLFSVVQGLPYQYANLTAFTTLSDDYEGYKTTNNTRIETLSDDYEAYKITSNSYLSILNNDIENLTTNLSILNTDISNNYVNNTTLTTLTTAIDNQFETTTHLLASLHHNNKGRLTASELGATRPWMRAHAHFSRQT